MSNDVKHLESRIKELEKENAALRLNPAFRTEGATVSVPEAMKPLFDVAQQTVNNYFVDLKMEPTKGTIEINDQRYILIRASAMSKDFLDTIQSLYADRGESEAISIGKNFLFDVAHTLGINDARNFHVKMNLTEPIAKLSAGPVHFAYTGWAFVDILPESNPSPDENFYLIYNHPFSFEADSWKRSGKKSTTSACIMSSGYSSGWCEESFGIPLTAVEVTCIAKGDERCTFIMSPPHKIQGHLDRFHLQGKDNVQKQASYDIPTFFERKNIEEEMQQSRALAESSAKAKEDFVANMSHELRTPLGSILGFTALLKKTDLSGTQKEYLDAISSSGNSLLAIINNILDLSKLDAGKFALENVPFNIPDLLLSVQNMFAQKAKDKNLLLTASIDAALNYSVYGDPMRLTQILINLLGNAVKFTEAGSIGVRCTIDTEDNHEACICFFIKDTGIGIPADKIPFVFERFTQAETDITRRFGGTGLGLAITKQLIELLGGKIVVKSHEGSGTEFSFSLTYAKAPAEASILKEQIAVRPVYNTEKTVLVVEDNLMNQKLTGIILKNNGFNFIIAENGSVAVKILADKKPDLILMDIQMPVMDGYEATCIIRDELHIKTPIIAMTAHALAGEKEKCIEQGINDYLPKPFTEADLLRKLARWLAYTSETNTVTEEPVTDLSFLRKQTGGDENVIKEMAAMFVTGNPGEISALENEINKKDYPAIFKRVHSLRNSTALLGLNAHIGEALLSMEKDAHAAKDITLIKHNFATVKQCCQRAVAELKTKT